MEKPAQFNARRWALLLVEFCSSVFALFSNVPPSPRGRAVVSSWQQGGCRAGGWGWPRITLQSHAGIQALVGEGVPGPRRPSRSPHPTGALFLSYLFFNWVGVSSIHDYSCDSPRG